MENYYDYSDFEPLSLTDEELALLKKLRSLSDRDGFEYGVAFADGVVTKIFTNGFANKVSVPNNIYAGNIRLFHSHTIRSPLSPSDLFLLTNPRISEIAVITSDGSVFRAMVNGGIKPSEDEYYEDTDGLDDEVNFEMIERPEFNIWDIELRKYMASKEQMFRIARLFKWVIEGGRI